MGSSCFLFQDCCEPLEISSQRLGKGCSPLRLALGTRVTSSGRELQLPAGAWQENNGSPFPSRCKTGSVSICRRLRYPEIDVLTAHLRRAAG